MSKLADQGGGGVNATVSRDGSISSSFFSKMTNRTKGHVLTGIVMNVDLVGIKSFCT